MYYLIITMTLGWIDCGTVGGVYYRTKKDVEEAAAKARTLPDVVKVEIMKKGA